MSSGESIPGGPTSGGASPAAPRLAAVDVARGAALVAMALFHATWDLGHLRLTPENLAFTPAGRGAARLIAGSFLVLVGISLVLARGWGRRRDPRTIVRSGPYRRRLARVAAAALAVTLATRVLFPDSYIFFGVLHHIALASVVALPFLRAPPLATLLAAGLVGLAPLALTQGVFDAPLLAFLGLGTRVPEANDYVPVFPWFGAVLAGIAAAGFARDHLPGGVARWASWRPSLRATRGLALAGRHSLAIYLVHQPLLYGVLAGVAAVTGPHPRAEETAFRRAYEADCRATGRGAPVCRAVARCFAREARAAGLWRPLQDAGALSDADRARAITLLRECFRRADEAPEPGGEAPSAP